MKLITLLICTGLGLSAHSDARAQGTPPDTMPRGSTRLFSGVIRPTRPAIVDMGFGWRFKTGEGYTIAGVRDDSPASRAGLIDGDMLIAIDGRAPDEPDALFPNNAPGRHYRLRVQRGDQELELEVISGPPRPLPPL
jgi:predicted metalloprotease with PDZ domain